MNSKKIFQYVSGYCFAALFVIFFITYLKGFINTKMLSFYSVLYLLACGALAAGLLASIRPLSIVGAGIFLFAELFVSVPYLITGFSRLFDFGVFGDYELLGVVLQFLYISTYVFLLLASLRCGAKVMGILAGAFELIAFLFNTFCNNIVHYQYQHVLSAVTVVRTILFIVAYVFLGLAYAPERKAAEAPSPDSSEAAAG